MRRLAPLVVVALIALAGCGSSSVTSSSVTETTAGGEESLTKADFIAKADALCEASKAKQAPLRQNLDELTRRARVEEQSNEGLSDGTRKELSQTLRRIVATTEASLSQVQALGLPQGETVQLETIFEKTESTIEASLAYGRTLENHEDARAQTIAEKGNTETRETAALAKQYGLKVCGSQP